ncbi:DNA-binding transcriptional regulator, IclR family [Micromonospora viridifaciens]|uniref:DNA-binding transcriptional regulator, IclR family n=1 Tax=Micromonospora viridifaciens TaxID=1881 RepID=A0A1C4WSJ9_MICVI|nr:IclR family transcriptional regulator [Micromonospora viridifaciens]SCE99227.1 DNA-binding transcriptional regulator, IclR family [Micromonospora viridifaciens]
MQDPLTAQPGARNNSASLRRALSILVRLGEDEEGLGRTLTQLCNDLDMNKSTVLRLLRPLIDARFVQATPNGSYRLGWRNAQLGQTYLATTDLHRDMRDVLVDLGEKTGETVHLVTPDFPNVVYVDKVDSPRSVRMASRIGSAQPAYCTSVGKAMLAYSPDDAVKLVVDHGLRRRTPRTITTAADLQVELARVRELGYAVDDVENEDGVRCVAAPIFGTAGTAVSAISVSAPEERLPAEAVPDIAPHVMAAAAEISRRLGARR